MVFGEGQCEGERARNGGEAARVQALWFKGFRNEGLSLKGLGLGFRVDELGLGAWSGSIAPVGTRSCNGGVQGFGV